MEKLIPDTNKEMDDIAKRLVVILIENPDNDLRGMLFSLKSRINRVCFKVAEWPGEKGKLWKSEIKMCDWSRENGAQKIQLW
jgi:hypothetical protein